MDRFQIEIHYDEIEIAEMMENPTFKATQFCYETAEPSFGQLYLRGLRQ